MLLSPIPRPKTSQAAEPALPSQHTRLRNKVGTRKATAKLPIALVPLLFLMPALLLCRQALFSPCFKQFEKRSARPHNWQVWPLLACQYQVSLGWFRDLFLAFAGSLPGFP